MTETIKAKRRQPARKGKAGAAARSLRVETDGEEPISEAVARKINAPWTRHGLAAMEFQGQIVRGLPDDQRPDLVDFAKDLMQRGKRLGAGELDLAGHLLASQAITLDAIFTECARRSGLNMSDYPQASERYMRLALKAQANSRATLEALAKLHQPREQTVRHVHVNEGGNAVVAENFHHHAGGHRNAETAEQPHATGTGAPGSGPAMLGHDAQRDGVPIPGDQRCETMPDARRQGKRRA